MVRRCMRAKRLHTHTDTHTRIFCHHQAGPCALSPSLSSLRTRSRIIACHSCGCFATIIIIPSISPSHQTRPTAHTRARACTHPPGSGDMFDTCVCALRDYNNRARARAKPRRRRRQAQCVGRDAAQDGARRQQLRTSYHSKRCLQCAYAQVCVRESVCVCVCIRIFCIVVHMWFVRALAFTAHCNALDGSTTAAASTTTSSYAPHSTPTRDQTTTHDTTTHQQTHTRTHAHNSGSTRYKLFAGDLFSGLSRAR